MKNDKMYLKLNAFSEDIPIIIILRVNTLSRPDISDYNVTRYIKSQGMGVETDQEIVQLVGTEELFLEGLAPSLEECSVEKVFTQQQALEYIGSKIKVFKNRYSKRPKV